MNGKEIEELKVELNHVKEQNQELFQTIVEPGLHSKVQEFLDSFEDYFREKGFVIRKKNDKVRVSFDDLHLKAFSDGGRDIFIMRGKEQIASVTVTLIGEGKPGSIGQMPDSLDQLEKELEKEKSLSYALKNPVFYYTGREFGIKYETPLSVLNSIFGI
ncbi:hypothetical protein BGM25_21685 [Bacillus sp. FJAT-29953]|nr:hypothetical protein [Bacillus sp. FJAT-29953]